MGGGDSKPVGLDDEADGTHGGTPRPQFASGRDGTATATTSPYGNPPPPQTATPGGAEGYLSDEPMDLNALDALLNEDVDPLVEAYRHRLPDEEDEDLYEPATHRIANVAGMDAAAALAASFDETFDDDDGELAAAATAAALLPDDVDDDEAAAIQKASRRWGAVQVESICDPCWQPPLSPLSVRSSVMMHSLRATWFQTLSLQSENLVSSLLLFPNAPCAATRRQQRGHRRRRTKTPSSLSPPARWGSAR
jgi:hypothetical protein